MTSVCGPLAVLGLFLRQVGTPLCGGGRPCSVPLHRFFSFLGQSAHSVTFCSHEPGGGAATCGSRPALLPGAEPAPGSSCGGLTVHPPFVAVASDLTGPLLSLPWQSVMGKGSGVLDPASCLFGDPCPLGLGGMVWGHLLAPVCPELFHCGGKLPLPGRSAGWGAFPFGYSAAAPFLALFAARLTYRFPSFVPPFQAPLDTSSGRIVFQCLPSRGFQPGSPVSFVFVGLACPLPQPCTTSFGPPRTKFLVLLAGHFPGPRCGSETSDGASLDPCERPSPSALTLATPFSVALAWPRELVAP